MPRNAAGAEVPGLQLGRERARHLPRPRHPALQPARARSRAWPSAATRWTPRSATTTSAASSWPSRCRASRRRSKEAYAAGLARQEHAAARASTSTSTRSSARAPTSAARKPRCSSRSRASRASRASSRRSRPHYGLYGKPTTINNTQSFASVPTILRKGAEWFAELGVQNSGGTVDFLGVRPRREARQLRAAARHPVHGPARDRGRRARRAQAQGRDPGRLVGARWCRPRR